MKKQKTKRKPIPYLWMSYADDNGFRGVVIVRARDIVEGVIIAHRLQINPGGQVRAHHCPEDFHVPETAVGRLLDRQDLQRLFPEAGIKSLREHEEDMRNEDKRKNERPNGQENEG